MSNIRVAVVQQAWQGDQSQTLNATKKLVEEACHQGANLVVLQELHSLPYFCQSENTGCFAMAESIDGQYVSTLASWASDNKIVLVGSFFEKRAPGLYHNTSVVLDSDGTLAGRYRKMHIPDDPGFYEKFYFTPGDAVDRLSGFEPIQTSLGLLGVLICWDQWYPEAARLMALAGAQILIYPTAIGWDPRDDEVEQKRQLEAWLTIQRSHAVANGIPVISCNRIGFETDSTGQSAGIQFWGNSFVCGPQGEYLEQANATDQDILVTDLNIDQSAEVRQIWPFFRDRRVDAYAGLTKRYLD